MKKLLIDIINSFEVKTIMEALGDPLNMSSGRNECPFCGSSDGLSLDLQTKFKCFSCDIYGDTIDYIVARKMCDLDQALKEACNILEIPFDEDSLVKLSDEERIKIVQRQEEFSQHILEQRALNLENSVERFLNS